MTDRKNYYQKTRKAYDANAKAYFQKIKDFPPSSLLLELIDSLKPGSKVVDLGCGPARDAKYFINKGIEYLGIDFSQETINLAKKINPDAKFLVADIRFVDLPVNSMDAFTALASLYHLDKLDFKRILKKIHDCLKPRGKFLLLMKKGRGEVINSDQRYSSGEKFATYYSKIELENHLKESGFRIKKSFVVSKEKVYERTNSNYQSHPAIFILAETM